MPASARQGAPIPSHASACRTSSSHNTAEADMAHAAVDHVRVARRRAIAPAVIGRAKKGAALDHLARNSELRLGGVETGLYRAAPRIVRDAARAFGVPDMPGAEPVGGPFPDISCHVEEPMTVWRKGADRRSSLEAVGAEVLPREFALPGVCHLAVFRRQFIAPDKLGAVQSAARRKLPLGLGRQRLTRPVRVSRCVLECDLDDGMVEAGRDRAALAFPGGASKRPVSTPTSSGYRANPPVRASYETPESPARACAAKLPGNRAGWAAALQRSDSRWLRQTWQTGGWSPGSDRYRSRRLARGAPALLQGSGCRSPCETRHPRPTPSRGNCRRSRCPHPMPYPRSKAAARPPSRKVWASRRPKISISGATSPVHPVW